MSLPPNAHTRRQFLRTTTLATGGLATGVLAGCQKSEDAAGIWPGTDRQLGLVIGAGRFEDGDKTTHILTLVDLDADATNLRWFGLDFFGHGVVEHPLQRNKAMVFEKKGPGACEVDLIAREVLRPVTTKKSRHFYGHGAYSPDASLLYCTESDLENDYAGVVAVRDAKTMEVLGEFPSYGSSPHDCVLVDDGKTMVITNAGGEIGSDTRPSVTYVDVANQSLQEKLEFDSDQVSAGHLAISERGDLVCVGAPRDGLADKAAKPGHITIRTLGGSFRTMQEPREVTDRMLAETLSVAIHEPSRSVLATNPAGNIATLWDLDSGSYLQHFDLEYPRGAAVTLDGSSFALSYGRGRSDLVRIDPKTHEVIADSTRTNTGCGGSHLFLYDPPSA